MAAPHVFDAASALEEPSSVNSSHPLTREQLLTLRDEGLVRVPGLIPRPLVDRAREVIDRHLHLFSDENDDEDGSLGEVRTLLRSTIFGRGLKGGLSRRARRC